MNHSIEEKICIVGTGGFAREALCILIDILAVEKKDYRKVAVFMEKDDHLNDKSIMGIPVIPESSFDPPKYHVIIGIGDPQKRKKVVESLPSNTVYTKLVHPSVIMSRWVEVEEGAVICAGNILTCNIKIRKHAQLNLNTTIGHDCEIGNYFTSAPGVNISGNCKIGERVYCGTNVAVKQGIEICNDVIIGMGGIVLKSITEKGTYIGCPAKKIG